MALRLHLAVLGESKSKCSVETEVNFQTFEQNPYAGLDKFIKPFAVPAAESNSKRCQKLICHRTRSTVTEINRMGGNEITY